MLPSSFGEGTCKELGSFLLQNTLYTQKGVLQLQHTPFEYYNS